MIEIDDKTYNIEVTAKIFDLINDVIKFSLNYINFKYDYELCVTLTDNNGIQTLNKKHRNIDRETDVLSFPMLEFDDGPYNDKYDFSKETNPETGKVMLGDIVLSLEQARIQAIEYGHSYDREISYLLVHSILHLMGYDHIEEEDRVIMRSKEEDILKVLKLTR